MASTPAAARMSSASERTIAFIFRALAITFAVVGVLFLVFPDGTVRVINATGTLFRIFPPAPPSELRFWLSLGVSYMALVTILAALIQKDPIRYQHLMPVLAAGKFCSSFTCLLFFIFSSPTFLYLLNFLVDGSITVLVLGCYTWTSLAAQSSHRDGLVGPEAAILEAVVDTLVPIDGAFPLGGAQTPLGRDLTDYCAALNVHGLLGFALLLRTLDYGPYLFGPRRTRFTRLSVREREQYLAGFEKSRIGVRRQLIASLKLIAFLHFYDYPQAQQAVGYDGTYLRQKLLAGPNAAYHRARYQ
jgi:hypothetical protein